MKHFCLRIGSTALLLTGFTFLPIHSYAQDTTAPVPTRSNETDPNSEVYRASDIMGMTIKDDQGQEVGKIKDLVINGSSREVLYAVVGMNDAKEKDAVYVMPWTVFQPTYGQGNAIQYTVLTIPQTVWMQAPVWTNTQWRQTPYSQWSGRVNQYYETHIHTNTASNAKSTTVRTNKPVLKNDQHPDKKEASPPSKDNPAAQPNKSEKPQPKVEPNKPKDEPKPKASSEPKPNQEPKTAEKPKPKEAEIPAAKTPKLPAPKNPDPAGPESPKRPEPRDPKVPAPTPK